MAEHTELIFDGYRFTAPPTIAEDRLAGVGSSGCPKMAMLVAADVVIGFRSFG